LLTAFKASVPPQSFVGIDASTFSVAVQQHRRLRGISANKGAMVSVKVRGSRSGRVNPSNQHSDDDPSAASAFAVICLPKRATLRHHEATPIKRQCWSPRYVTLLLELNSSV